MVIRARISISKDNETSLNVTDDSNSTSAFGKDIQIYWSGRNHKTYANTTCSFIFSTLGDQDVFKSNLIYVQIIPAVLMMLFFAFVVKSERPLRSFFRCRPTVSVPVKLNEQRYHRGLICAAFGIAIWTVMQIIFSGKSVYEWNYDGDIHAMLMILHCVLTGVIFWPVMAAINTRYLPGQILGCIYIWWCAICAALVSLPCEFSVSDTIIVGIEMLPLYAFMLYICFAMPIRMIRCIHERRKRKTGNWVEPYETYYQVQHVRRMLRRTKRKKSMQQNEFDVNPTRSLTFIEKWKRNIIDGNDEGKKESEKTREEKDLDTIDESEKKILNARFYKVLPGFRYSLNILVAVTITQTAIFLLAASGFRYHTVLLNATIRFVEALNSILAVIPEFLTGNKTAVVIDIAEQLDNDRIRGYVRTPVFASIVAAYLLNLLAMLLTMRNYRKHLIYLYHGQHVKIPEYNKIKSAAGIMTSSTKYIGYQLGYGIYAYFVQMFWLILIFGGIWTCVILVCVYGHTKTLLKVLKNLVPVVVYVLVMKLGQKFLVYYFFCQKGERKKGTMVPAITNRNCYMNYHYFMVFINAPLGILNAFGRVIKMSVFNFWTMPRCDIPSLSREFEVMDTGFRTYVCMLTMENAMTNPLLFVFTQHLFNTVHHDNEHPEDVTGTKCGERDGLALESSSKRPSVQLSPRSKLARNRWHLLYTLHNNPVLCAYRSHANVIILPITITISRDPGTFVVKREERLIRMSYNDYSSKRIKSRAPSPNG